MSDAASTARAGFRGYITSRRFFGDRVPQHVQNLVIRDYAERNGLLFKLSAVEYAMPGCTMILDQVLEQLPDLEGLICYSMFQLPEKFTRRTAVYQAVLGAGATLHFALEDLVVASAADMARVEDIWLVRQTLPRCPAAVSLETA